MKNKKVRILGTEYEIVYSNDKSKYAQLKDLVGFMDSSNKKIVVQKEPDENEKNKGDWIKVRNEVVRHEVIHAYLYESGLDGSSNGVVSWATNEEMVDYFAIQIPKIVKTFKELGVE